MTKFIYAATALAILAGCDAVEVLGDVPPPPPPPPPPAVPEAIAGDLRAASYDAENDAMNIRITLDASAVDAVYTRNATYDVPGYVAFTKQDDPLDRFFTAFYRASTDGSVQASLVVDGGQFTKYFGGTIYSQNGTYIAPVQGLVSYAGSYVGLTNISTREGTLPSGEPRERLAARASRTTGQVFLNADFGSGTVNGIIDNRVLAEAVPGGSQTGIPLPSLFLIPAPIAANGGFEGTIENIEQEGLGSYAGAFGGVNASSVAGGVRLTGDFFPQVENEEEYGIFVLDRCGVAPSVCEQVKPLND